ncbi:GDSL-type esterase/lipase family protein [Parapedobacter sp.]
MGYILLCVACLATQAVALGKPIKVACIGNSVTAGWGLQDTATSAYPAQLQSLLGGGYSVANFGHSGATLLRHGHNPYERTAAFSRAVAFAPDIAIIHLGLNDTDPRNWPNYRDDFVADYGWLVDTLRTVNPAMHVFICRLTPIFSGHPRFKSSTREWYWQIQARLPEIAEHYQVGLIDLHTPLYHRPDLFDDNLHPDATGASIIARTVYAKLTGDFGGLQLPPIFANHMVIQRNKPIRIYGTADAAETVEVEFAGHVQVVQTDTDGQWAVIFDPMEAGGPHRLTIRDAHQSIALHDILIGDVWLCSGQSNMAFPLRAATGGDSLAAITSAHGQLRLARFQPLKETNNEAWDAGTLQQVNELNYFSGDWTVASPTTARDFSAVAYAFGTRVLHETNVPIGLIQVAVGGSGIESWVDRYTLEHDPLLIDMLNGWRTSDFLMPWCRERAAVNLAHATRPKQRHPYEPAYNFEAGIAHLAGMSISGVLWYQGESNAQNSELYPSLFAALVESWRRRWGDSLPFYYVQLSSIDRSSWPRFRNMQRQLQHAIPNVWMAVSSDLGDSLDVHPRHKLPIGKRLADLALSHTYHRDIPAATAEVSDIKWQNGELVLIFSNTDSLTTRGGKPLVGFEYVTKLGVAITIQGRISGNKVFLPLPQGVAIHAVRYAWQPFTRANLESAYGVPVSTFYKTIN